MLREVYKKRVLLGHVTTDVYTGSVPSEHLFPFHVV